MRQFVLLTLITSLVFAACSEPANTEEETTATENQGPVAPPQSALGEAGTGKLMTLVSDYYRLKDALVATDAAKADEAARKLLISTDSMRSMIQSDSTADGRILTLLDTVKLGSEQILAAKDETTEQKRIHFEKVSDAMFSLLKQADLRNAGIYRQYCPMAFNDKGAYWLSNETDIKNPYFGKKMLECGEVTDTLK